MKYTLPNFKYRLVLAGVLMFVSNITLAQINLSITGLVISAKGELPLEGVNVSIENKGIGSATNSDGKFILVLHITVNPTDSLTFSCIGYETKRVGVIDASVNKSLTVKLETSVTNLAEVNVKPVSLKSLLDSIIDHNTKLFVSPAELKGYYRELAYTDTKCTEFSDALCSYYFDRTSAPDGQFKIDASRCLEAKEPKYDRHNFEAMLPSFIRPNAAFQYAMLKHLVEKFFPDKTIANYDYIIEQTNAESEGDLKIVISPKPSDQEDYYQLVLFLTNDLTLISLRMDVPEKLAARIEEKSFLGLHARVTKLNISVNYSALAGSIYPGYYNMSFSYYLRGKFMGVTFNQTDDNKTEFVVTEVKKGGDARPFERKAVYKKGNLCDNGTAITNDLLKNCTIIKLSQKDSVEVKGFVGK